MDETNGGLLPNGNNGEEPEMNEEVNVENETEVNGEQPETNEEETVENGTEVTSEEPETNATAPAPEPPKPLVPEDEFEFKGAKLVAEDGPAQPVPGANASKFKFLIKLDLKKWGPICGAVLLLLIGSVLLINILSNRTVESAAELPTEPEMTATPTPAPTPTPSPTPAPSPTPEPEPEPEEDVFINYLTGLPIDEELVNERPIAAVVNNMVRALPQSGFGSADVYYEVLAEGDITRIVAFFHGDRTAEKVGPIRSTRHYFSDFTMDHDALYVHHGGSPQGYTFISSYRIENLDGMREAACFWRDPVRASQPGMLEHSSYTSMERIAEAVDKHGFRTELDPERVPPWDFYDEFTAPEDWETAEKIVVPFSANYRSAFEYNVEEGLYYRFQRDEPTVDEQTGTQIAVTNIVVQFANIYGIAGDTSGRREVVLVANGDGLLITAGKCAPITWEKESHESATVWYGADGEKLMLNKGKTWIEVFSDSSSATVSYEPSEQ